MPDRGVTGAGPTTATAAPFAVNSFLSGTGSITAQSAKQIRQDKRGSVRFAGHFTPASYPTLALPLANGLGFWLIGVLT
jgi:hypothetical protein